MAFSETDTAPLFVAKDSPSSKVELLVWDQKKPSLGERERPSREKSVSTEFQEPGVSTGGSSVDPRPRGHEGENWCNSGEPNNAALPWKLLTRASDVEHRLKTEHQFRACVVRQRNSHSKLSVSRDLFKSFYCKSGISSQFKDVIIYFGSRDLEVEVAAPRLRFSSLSPRNSMDRRSGFECVYGLRFMELNNRGDPQRLYSLRQMAVGNQEDKDLNLSTWLFVSPPPSILLLFSGYVGKQESDSSRNPFDIHLLFFQFAITSWRPYLVHLTQEVHQHANTSLLAAPDGNGPVGLSACGDLQRLKQLGDDMLDAKLAMATTRDAMDRLLDGYTAYAMKSTTHDKVRIEEHEDEVYHQLLEHSRELDWLLQQTDGLRQKLLGTSQLVSSFMALGNGLSLEDLGKEARKENSQMHQLTKKSTEDAAAVKVLTVIMLVYLPATVVSNFFSTSFVDNTSTTGSPKRLKVLSNWWVFVVVAVPLTIVTLYVWWVVQGIQASGTYPRWWHGITSLRSRPRTTDEENARPPVSASTTTGDAYEKT